MIIKAKTLIFTDKKYETLGMKFAIILHNKIGDWFFSDLPWILAETATLNGLKQINKGWNFKGIKLVDIEIHIKEL